MENRRKSEDNEMQLKTGRQAWKISKKRFSQTVRRPISQCENFADLFRNAKIHQPKFAMRKFTNPNSQCEISQCQMPFRNANFNFAMRKFRNAKFRNAKCHFAMPILNLHCQFQFRNAKISQFQIRNAKISQCEISQCQSPFRIAKITAFAKFTLRNLQALSSYVINAEPPSIFGVLLF